MALSIQEAQEQVKNLENSPLRLKIKEQTKYIPSINNINIPSINKLSIETGYTRISPDDFKKVASQLTHWEVTNSGAVIAREGATYVKTAMEITLENISFVKCPKAYFRGVLKKLKGIQEVA